MPWLISSNCSAGAASVGTKFTHAGLHLALQAGYSDHGELVQDICRDGQKAQPFEQGIGCVRGFFEHTLVEGQPRQLTIEEPLGGRDQFWWRVRRAILTFRVGRPDFRGCERICGQNFRHLCLSVGRVPTLQQSCCLNRNML